MGQKPLRALNPRETKIVAAYTAGKSLAAIGELYEINPAAIQLLMMARYGRTGRANTITRGHTPPPRTPPAPPRHSPEGHQPGEGGYSPSGRMSLSRG